MPEREREQNVNELERELFPRERRKARQNLAEQAMQTMSFLEEVETSYEDERDYLRNTVIGQDDAIETVIQALDRRNVRSKRDLRPVASLAFLGPTGVGKTEMARRVADIMNLAESKLLKIDCSAYSNGHNIADLIGAPPGYVGRGQEPILNQEAVGTRGSVVVFDEVEKGSQELHDLLLQITESGSIVLKNGKETSFRNSVVVMTSNLGATEMIRQAKGSVTGFGASQPDNSKSAVEAVALKSFKEGFRPELINRLDNMVVFHQLDKASLHEVLGVKLRELNEDYVDDYGIEVDLSEGARSFLIDETMKEPENGARPLVRALDRNVISQLGRQLAANRVDEGTDVVFYHRDEVTQYLPKDYKGNLAFGVRPNALLRRKVEEESSEEHSVFFREAAGKEVVPFNKSLNDDAEDIDDPDDLDRPEDD